MNCINVCFSLFLPPLTIILTEHIHEDRLHLNCQGKKIMCSHLYGQVDGLGVLANEGTGGKKQKRSNDEAVRLSEVVTKRLRLQ